jgi:starch phosphorylase
VEELKGHYRPWEYIAASEALTGVMALLKSGHFNLQEPEIFAPIVAAIESPTDPWMLAADFESLRLAQLEVAKAYQDWQRWTAMSIRNTAASGRFSSDVTIAGYRDHIWKAR